MSVAQDYRAKADEYIQLAREAVFLSDIRNYVRRAQYLTALAESEEWLEANRARSASKHESAVQHNGHAFAVPVEHGENPMMCARDDR